jgi:ABC-2 type transport system permease protein
VVERGEAMSVGEPAMAARGVMAGRESPNLFWVLVRVNVLQAWRRLQGVRHQSKLLTLLVGAFLAGYVVLAFGLFSMGLRFVGSFPGLGALLVERLMFLMFAILFVLLLFSNLVIGYTNLFRNRETTYLLAMPVPLRSIIQWKFIESTLLASWAFLFLIAPLVLAYGLHRHVPWHFFAVAPFLVMLFIVLPAAGGAWVSMCVARYLDRRLFQVMLLLGVLVVVTGVAFWLKAEPAVDELTETRVLEVLDRLLAKTAFSEFALLPSYWLSSAILQWSEGALSTALFYGLVLLSYTLFFGYLSLAQSGGFFYDAASRVNSRSGALWRWSWFRSWKVRRREARYGVGVLERVGRRLGGWLGSDTRALLVKDIRLFWRDTAQWGQTLVLFALLGVYILNLRHFAHQLTNPFWIHLVSHLNLGACALNLATLTTRFIYPQFSLEGKRIWIVGMAPVGLVRVVRTKFWLAMVGSLVVTLGLILLSCWMLRLPLWRVLYFAGAITLMTFTLNGLAVGLGALYPNFREEHPGKIVSGFGGTFCLVLSFVYIVASVVLLALGSPWPWMGGGRSAGSATGPAWAVFLLLSLGLGWVPLRMGLKRVARFEL